MREIVSNVEPFFHLNPQRSALICYSLAKIAEENKDFSEAEQKYYDSLQYYYGTKNDVYIAKAQHFVGCFEYRQGNYEKAKEFFEQALPVLANDTRARLISLKEYAKTLMKLGEERDAENFIRQGLVEIRTADSKNNLDDLMQQYTLLLGVCLDKPELLDEVLSMENATGGLKIIVAEHLLNYYEKIDDSVSVLKYYRIAKQLSQPLDILDREGV